MVIPNRDKERDYLDKKLKQEKHDFADAFMIIPKEDWEKTEKMKTIKDLRINYMMNYGADSLFWKEENGKREYLFEEDLKQEAIKEIKEFQKQRDTDTEWTFLYNPTKGEIDAVITYIKWKFNISEKDLKQELK